MRLTRTWCVIVGLMAIAGCHRNQTLPCQPEARYSGARSAPPVQIPDDLSPPDESDAIRLPADFAPVGSITAGECLENPPPLSGDSRPFVTSEEGQSRKQRREAKRAERAQSSAPQPAAPASQSEAAPPKQPDPPPAGDDRVISN